MILGLGAAMSVGVVDAYFIGQIDEMSLTAISFIFPVQVALQSLGVGVMVGINSVVARALGARRPEAARNLALHGVALAGLVGTLIAAAIVVLHTPFFRCLNADADVLPLISDYVVPYAFGYPFVLIAMAINGVCRGQGEAVKSSTILFIVAIVNWILDPILIAGWGPAPSYGIRGAAYATTASFILSALVGVALVQRTEVRLRPLLLFKGDWRNGMADLVRVGGPAAFSNSVNPLGLTLLTGLLASYGAHEVAGFGVAGRVQSLAVVPLLAMSSSIGPIVGQNWGAGRRGRSRLAWRFASWLSFGYGTTAALLLVLFRGPVADLFTDSAVVNESLGRYLVIAAWGYGGFGLLIVTNAALNAIGYAMTAFWVSVARVFAVMLPAAWCFGPMLGADAVYASVLAANTIGGLTAVAFGYRALYRNADAT